MKYVVALNDSSIRSGAAFQKSFVYKVKARTDRTGGVVSRTLIWNVEVDSKDSTTNAWSQKYFREATEEEAQLYELSNKPVHIEDNSLEGQLSKIKREISDDKV